MDSAKKAKMTQRVIFGAIMIGVLAGILWGDWRLEQHAWGLTRDAIKAQTSPAYRTTPSVRAYHAALKGLPVAILIALISVAAFLEVRRMAAANGARMLTFSGLLATVLLATCPHWWKVFETQFMDLYLNELCVVPLAIGTVFAEQMIRRRTQDAFRDLAATVLAVGYVGGGAAAILFLRMTFGLPSLVLFLIAVKFTDIGAYFTGSFLGKHKLIPWLSPGKSWEGLLGGLTVAAGMCMMTVFVAGWRQWQGWPFVIPPTTQTAIFGATFGEPHPFLPGYLKAALFGAVVGLVGQFADLCESLLKRSASLKDSGALVPEFGGVLDIIDSLLLSAPVAAILLAVMA